MVGIVIPVFNEGPIIGKTLDDIAAKVHVEHKIYIVYDMEEDDTLPVVKERMLRQSNLVPVKNYFGRGGLNAIKTGFVAADCEALVVVMADSSDDLTTVDQMYRLFLGGYDIVCGSRYMPGGKQLGGQFIKRAMSRTAGVSLHWIIGIPTHDITNAFKLYRKSVLDSISIESDGGFELSMEIVIKAFLAGYRIGEVPTTWQERTNGDSRFQLWRWLPKYLKWYCFAILRSGTKYFIQEKPVLTAENQKKTKA